MQARVKQLAALLETRGWKLATAESCTGGGLAYRLTQRAGSSIWFDRGFVTYSNAAKMEMLGVAPAILTANGAVSPETAQAMAEGARQHSQADIAIAITGIAGPGGGTATKPVGMVCFAWACRDKETFLRTEQLPGDRQSVRQQAIIIALEGLLAVLNSQ